MPSLEVSEFQTLAFLDIVLLSPWGLVRVTENTPGTGSPCGRGEMGDLVFKRLEEKNSGERAQRGVTRSLGLRRD